MLTILLSKDKQILKNCRSGSIPGPPNPKITLKKPKFVDTNPANLLQFDNISSKSCSRQEVCECIKRTSPGIWLAIFVLFAAHHCPEGDSS